MCGDGFAVDLARSAAGEVGDDMDPFGHRVVGEALAQKRFGRMGVVGAPQRSRVGDTEYTRLGDSGAVAEDRFDEAGKDFLAAAVDHVVDSAGQKQ